MVDFLARFHETVLKVSLAHRALEHRRDFRFDQFDGMRHSTLR
jgi:hypothetical protein